MIPGRASVVRDRFGGSLFVAAPRSADGRLHAIGARWDHDIRRWVVPVALELELREALAGLDVAWSADHRTVRRCAVCRTPLAPALVAAGDRVHIGCLLPDVQHNDDPEVLPW